MPGRPHSATSSVFGKQDKRHGADAGHPAREGRCRLRFSGIDSAGGGKVSVSSTVSSQGWSGRRFPVGCPARGCCPPQAEPAARSRSEPVRHPSPDLLRARSRRAAAPAPVRPDRPARAHPCLAKQGKAHHPPCGPAASCRDDPPCRRRDVESCRDGDPAWLHAHASAFRGGGRVRRDGPPVVRDPCLPHPSAAGTRRPSPARSGSARPPRRGSRPRCRRRAPSWPSAGGPGSCWCRSARQAGRVPSPPPAQSPRRGAAPRPRWR